MYKYQFIEDNKILHNFNVTFSSPKAAYIVAAINAREDGGRKIRVVDKNGKEYYFETEDLLEMERIVNKLYN